VIEGFRHRGLKRLYQRGDRSAVGADMIDKIERILTLFDDADRPEALDLPGMAFHPLKGDLKGFYAVTVRANCASSIALKTATRTTSR
jgi:proteic killer suppression protein